MHGNLITDIVKKIFPEGAEVCLESEAGPLDSRFWMFPGKGGEPRMILPHEPAYALEVIKHFRPYELVSRIKWKGLLAAYRSKRLNFIPGMVPFCVTVPENCNWNHLGWDSINPPVPVIYVGYSRPTRKAVFGLVNSQDYTVVSIGKVPLGSDAVSSIRHEVEILEGLAREKPGLVPRIVYFDRENGIATQEFFPGQPSGSSLTEWHVKFLVDLAIPGETISLREVGEDLEWQIKSLEHIDPETRAVLDRVLVEIDDSSPLPAVWVHGDFTQWNILKVTNSFMRAIDWELGLRHGFPGYDMVFFCSFNMYLAKNEFFPKSFNGFLKRYFKGLSIDPVMMDKIVIACFVMVWFKYQKIGNLPKAAFLLRMVTRILGDPA